MSVTSGDLEIVLPVHNEAGVLRASVEQVHAYLSVHVALPWTILIAANGSSDGTDRMAQELAQRLPQVRALVMPASGRGGALRQVWMQSTATFSLYMDIDLSTGLDGLQHALRLFDAGADVVAGSRLHRGARTTRCLKREILSRGYNFLLRRAFPGTVVDDGQCGFKGIRVARVQPLLPRVENNVWFFDTELLILAEHQGLDVRMFPVEWVEDPQTSVRIMSAIWEDLKGIQRLRGNLRKLPRVRQAAPAMTAAPSGRG